MNTTKQFKLNVGVIGANRIATMIAASFAASGHNIVGHSSTSAKSDARVKTLLKLNTNSSLVDIAENSNLLLLGVPGKRIREVVAEIAAMGKFHSEQFVIHVDGKYGIDVLEEAEHYGAQVFALHPIGMLSGEVVQIGALFDLPFVVSSRPMLRSVAEALVYDLHGRPFWLDSKYKVKYHALFTQITSNVASLMISVITSLREIGLDEPEELIGSYLRILLEKVFSSPSSIFFEGPIAFDEIDVIQAHMDALTEDFLQKKIYIDLTRLIIDQMLENKAIHPATAEEYLKVLKK